MALPGLAFAAGKTAGRRACPVQGWMRYDWLGERMMVLREHPYESTCVFEEEDAGGQPVFTIPGATPVFRTLAAARRWLDNKGNRVLIDPAQAERDMAEKRRLLEQ